MNYKQAIEAFVAKNRQVLSFLFRHRVKLDDHEFGIVLGHLSFAATEDGFHANGGIDREKVLEQIRQQPFAKRNLEVQMKALSWWEKGQTFNKPLPKAVEALPEYSTPVMVELKETHLRQYRDSFNGLADSVNGLTNKVYDLARFLVKNAASLDNQDVKREYSVRLASIRASLQSCEYRAKSGVVWASRVGIPMEKVARGINRVYLKRLRRAEAAFVAIDKLSSDMGVKSSMAPKIKQNRVQMRNDLLSVVRKEERQKQPVRHKQRQGHPVALAI